MSTNQKNKEMRLWELSGKSNIASGWYEIFRGILAPLLIIGLVVYIEWTKPGDVFKEIDPIAALTALGILLLFSLYRIGKGIWEIFLGRSRLLRKQWTWYFSVVTLPLAAISYLISYLWWQVKDLGHTIGIISFMLAFAVAYYYLWVIKDKFKTEEVLPLKDELQELSRWPASKKRPTFIFWISAVFIFLSLPLIFVNGLVGIFMILDPTGQMNDYLAIITGFLAGIAVLTSGIGLARMKEYGFIGAILATVLMAILAFISSDPGINIYLYGLIGLVLVCIYLFFEREKLN